MIEFKNENKIRFTKKGRRKSSIAKEYILSSKAAWYWITIILASVSILAVFAIPENDFPLVYLRSALGLILVLFLVGFTFIKTLFPVRMPINTSSKNMDIIELIALSIGTSLIFAIIVGLILNYTPWGIRLIPLTLSMLALTVVFATTAIIREYKTQPDHLQTNSESQNEEKIL